MKTDLPEPAEYYRPVRARELRERAARLEGCGRAVQVGLDLGFLIGLGGMLLGRGEWFTLMALLPLAARTFRTRLADQVGRLREQAGVLEAEHRACHGDLSPGEET